MKLHLQKRHIIGLGVLLAAIAITMAVALGYYPILKVNGSYVMARDYWTGSRAAIQYAAAYAKTYEKIASTTEPTADEVRLEVLNRLVESELIHSAAAQELASDYPYLLQSKMQSYDGDPQLKQVASTLFSLSYTDLRSQVLVPAAERDLLSGRLYLKGQKLEDWLASAKKDASVSIFSGAFYWDGQEVKAKN